MTDYRPTRIVVRSQAHRRHARSFPTGPFVGLCVAGLVGIVVLASFVGGHPAQQPSASGASAGAGGLPTGSQEVVATASPGSPAPPSPADSGLAGPSTGPTTGPVTAGSNIYAGTGATMFSPAVASFPPRVYVPDEASGRVIVIDPRTFKILYRYNVGASPEHVTPDWDLQRLYVEASFGGRLTVIDPKTGRPSGHHTVPGPYNLYFTVDGRMAIVVLDSRLSGTRYTGERQLYFYNRRTWRLIKAVVIPWAGADHLDFSADGRFFLLSTEYAGWVAKVDVGRMAVVNALFVGGQPIDVRLAPDGRVFYVANQATNGVSIIDPITMHKVGFVKTGKGAHGLAISRDTRWLYVTNRHAASLSVIDLTTRRLIHTWHIGGTPDMIAVSPDGTELWISNRYSGTVSVVNGQTGHVIKLIRVGGRPHGLAYFPEPGTMSLGHNGIYR